MNGTSLIGKVNLLSIPDPNWKIQGTSDFNQDGKTDIVWRNQANGANLVWLMNGTTLTGQVNLPSISDPNWQVVPFTQFGEPAIADLAGNTLATAFDVGILNGNGIYRDAVGTNDSNDFYRFSLSQPSTFGLSLTGLSANADVQLIQDVNSNGAIDPGDVLASSVNAGNLSESLSRVLTAGTYFVRVLPFSGDTNYSLLLSATPLPPDNAGNTLGNARNIGILSSPQTFTDYVGNIDTNDFYRFSLNQPGTFGLSLTGLSANADVQLIQDVNGNGAIDPGDVLASSVNAGNLSESLSRVLTAGTYFVRVLTVSGDTGYSLTLSATSSTTTPVDNAGNTLGTARNIGALSSSQVFNDFVGNADTNDFYRFSLGQTSTFNLLLNGLSADADSQLIQDVNGNGLVDSGDVIAYSFQGGNAPESLSKVLTAGTYFVRVFQYSGNTNYSLTLSATPYTAPVDNAGNTLGTARNIGTLSSPQTFTDFVGSADTNDFYRFSLSQSSSFNLLLNGLSADADVQLIQDVNGNGAIDTSDVLASSEKGGTTSENLTKVLNSGTYFVRVFQYSGDTNYSLTLSATPYTIPVDNAGNTLGTARNIGLLGSSQTFSDFVGDADVNDFYRFSLNQTSTFNLSLTGLTADADTQLIQDKNGNGLVDSGDVIAYPFQDGTVPENLTIGLAAGTYFIRIFQYSGNTNYTLTVSASQLNLPTGYDLNYGYGLVNAAAAVAQALGQSPFPNVPNLGGNNWGLDLVNAPEVWAKGYTGQGVVVAVVDTGVDYNHPDLNDNIWVNADEITGNGIDDDGNGFIDDVRGWDFVGNDNAPTDVYGHGTHVAGSIAAENNGFGVTGVAYNAKIMPVKVLSDSGSGSSANVAAGIRYAADNGANIINLSLGGGFSSAIEAAVQYATQKGSLVVMAAGNEGEAQPGFPANMATQIGLAVGAVDSNKKMADFSNRAGVTPVKYVVAPGVSVYSTTPNNTYQSFSGTSMATPHVAAVAALILSAKPNLTPAQLASLITGTANPTGITV